MRWLSVFEICSLLTEPLVSDENTWGQCFSNLRCTWEGESPGNVPECRFWFCKPGSSLRLCIPNKPPRWWGCCWCTDLTEQWGFSLLHQGSFSLMSVFCFSEWNAGGRTWVCSHAVHLAQLFPGHPPGETVLPGGSPATRGRHHPPPYLIQGAELLQVAGSKTNPGGHAESLWECPIKLMPTFKQLFNILYLENSIC